jgi:K+-sensing histidine kinase KdpD
MRERANKALKSCLGFAFCTSTAVLLSLFQHETADFRAACLGVCLLAVAVTSLLFGRWAALIGSASITLTLAVWLFPPVGSIAINNPAERQMLLIFQVGAVAAALLSQNKPQPAMTMKR